MPALPPPRGRPPAVIPSRLERLTAPMSVTPRRVSLRHDVPATHPDWVLEDEPVPESAVHDDAARTMDSTWRAWARRTGRDVCVHRNLAVRWDPQDARIGVDPDVALVEPPPATPAESLSSLRTWEPGNRPPRVALEVVSPGHPEKDYFHSPRKYAAAGVDELWVFDPLRLGVDGEGPWRIQVWRRAADGVFARVYTGEGPAWSDYFGAWLVAPEDGRLLRLSDDRTGASPWPTEGERAEQEREAREREREAKERALAERKRALAERKRALAERDRERLAKDQALARVAELEARLAARGDGS
jgi:Uma2 family endonuclease